ncbi:MAG: nicotinate (nicotinamide) nucleotide adenylyltransferase [Verrucomicrobia bacterium]|jgi:nicotinate-nucleotide adenylyltransferase|nr:nicotinate (nicotinamide) nucleotide adenylyltransferase [Verrucomicrobiota bacterium]
MKRIGLFGGSFDPVHCGHLLMARAAMEEAQLERMIFIPAAQSPFKPGGSNTPAVLRGAMLRQALAGQTQFEVDELEMHRGGVSYTIDTVQEFQRRHPDAHFWYIIGADHVPLLTKWREAEKLASLVEFLVIPRPGEPTTPLSEPFRGQVLRGFPFGVSSTIIRERVKAGLPIDHLVPPVVVETIRNNRLYL